MSLVAQWLRGSGPVPRSKSRFRLKARENKVIKVPGGAVLRGCKKTKRKLMAHFQLRAGVHSQLRVIASLYVLRIFLTCLRHNRVVLVDEHRTSRVSSAVNGQQPCERQLNKRRTTRPAGWKPPAGQVEPRMLRPAWSQQRDQPVRGMMWCPVVPPRKPPQAPRSSQEDTATAASAPWPSTPQPAKRSKRTKAEPEAAEPTKGKGKAQGKAAKAKPAAQPGRWLDRDCNAALNMQRIGESNWRPLELCYWPEQGKLPAKGKEYPGLGYKRLRDKPPKAQQQQQQPAVAHAASGVWDQESGQLVADQLAWWKLTKGQVRQASSLNNARRTTQQWLALVQPHLQHLAAVSSAGTSLEAKLKPRTGRWSQAATQPAAPEPGPSTPPPAKRSKRTKAGQAAEPNQPTKGKGKAQGKAAKAKPHHSQAALNMPRIGESRWRPLELCWGPEPATLPAKGKEYPGLGYKRVRDKPPKAPQQQPDPAVAHQQQWTGLLRPSQTLSLSQSLSLSLPQRTKAEPEAAEPTKGKGKAQGKAAKAKPVPQPGMWLDRDCNAALNMQRIGESMWRPLELCYWPEQGKLPAKGKEYPGLGYKRLRDKPPKAQQQQQQQPAVAHNQNLWEISGQLCRPALTAKGREYPGLGYKRVRDKQPKAQQQQPEPAVAQ
ncbi:hypothetical protein QJQ45_027282 [Haematococcus lacustris]|nr:hypothetical protein QJQ45_027282 [Haematococcus lacustris]